MKKLVIILLVLFAAGCTKKHMTSLQEPVKPSSATQEKAAGEGVDKENVTDRLSPDGMKESELLRDEASRMGTGALRDVYFDYNKYDISRDARGVLDSFVSYLKTKDHESIVIEGHCDERGTHEYNLALGEKRALAIKTYLASRGIARDKINVITYGEERPVCTEPSESCWQQNRRGHLKEMK